METYAVKDGHKFQQNVHCGQCGFHAEHDIHDPTTAPWHTFKINPHCNQCGFVESHAMHIAVKPVGEETIAEEAVRIVYGDREKAYDDPNVNFERIALMWTGTLLRKLHPGVTITPNEVALMFVQLKIAREVHKPNRDNRVDMIGYVLCDDRIVQKQEEDAREDIAMMDEYDASE